VAAAVPQQARLLESISHHRDAGPPNAHHLEYEFLGKLQIVAALQIAAAQQPSCEARFDSVRCTASGGLLRLHQNELLVFEERGAEAVARVCHVARSVRRTP
jgi:hypothetical protein